MFALRTATEADFEFTFSVKRDAMREHVAVRWGWDEADQRARHKIRWDEKPWQVIVAAQRCVGTVSVDVRPTHVQFGEFYILQAHRRRGLGTQVLGHVLDLADRNGVATRAEYLKWNPVASLYSRAGFRVVNEDDTHYYIVRPPAHGPA